MKTLSTLRHYSHSILGEKAYWFFFKWAVVGLYLFKNLKAKLGGSPRTPWICEFPDFEPNRSVAYSEEVYGDYLRYSGLHPNDLAGKSVLEIGPGENLGVALRFLADGAARVVSIDRFPSLRSENDQVKVYALLKSALGSMAADIQDVREENLHVSFDGKRLQYLCGVPVEKISAMMPFDQFDLVISRAVLEHVSDLDAAMAAMDALLKPGGMMIHEVDFRDHGMFTGQRLHPLTFLTIPRFLWRLMSSEIGAPNRKLSGFFAAKLKELGYDFQMLKILGVGSQEKIHEPFGPDLAKKKDEHDLVEKIRGNLGREYKDLSDEELAVSGIFLVASKRDLNARSAFTLVNFKNAPGLFSPA